MATDLYQTITDRILEMLDRGTVPWRHPISGRPGPGSRTGPGSGTDGLPRNLQSGKAYRGINVFLLAITGWVQGYDSAYWLTFRQAKERGGHIRKGEKSTPIVFWKQYGIEDRETGKPKTVPVLRHYNVFNVLQCGGITPPDRAEADSNAEPLVPIQAAERIVAGYAGPHSRETSGGSGGGEASGGPVIERGGSRAFYRPSTDTVRIPASARFVDRETYYATLFHELAHSTGHSSRLDRGLDTNLAVFGSADYSKEELIAEMGAAFLAATAGISPPTIEQSAAYIDGWREKLKGDKKLVIQAAGAGQRAADFILGQTFEAAAQASPPRRDASQSVGTPSPQPGVAVT